ncbi:prephenate dehydrogenase/arogenate dehydrogenase family protein, partial [Candidatus Dojkabacteria bacterium]|nr:prephenate dehydrogenase/arogenate dehydrogenase family protein [Candidatus Dojkabacteria bacterium]
MYQILPDILIEDNSPMNNKVIKIDEVTIIGYGRFGKTLHRMLKDKFNVRIFDKSKDVVRDSNLVAPAQVVASIKEIYQGRGSGQNRETGKFHAVFMAVPIEKFAQVINEHSQYFRSEDIIIDVLSVKQYPEKVLSKALKRTDVQAILTHPMFGPDSSKNGFEALPIVVDRFRAEQEVYTFWIEFFKSIGLKVVELSPSEHDKMAANSQGVTHFLGRLLDDFGLAPTPIDTLGARKLQEVMDQTCNDTWQLFRNLQNYNSYTKRMRIRLGNSYDKLYNQLLPKRVNPDSVVYGIQGGIGSFNEQALKFYTKTYKDSLTSYKTKYLYTTDNVLKALHRGEIDCGQFAVQNSVGGMVEESI